MAADFDCGRHTSLNERLKHHAWANQLSETSRTYVVHRELRIAGYYSIATGSVRREDVPERIGKGLAQHPVPVILLARLAIDRNEQGKGLGQALLKAGVTAHRTCCGYRRRPGRPCPRNRRPSKAFLPIL